MSNTQDTNSQGQAEPSESLKDAVQNEIASTPAKDALGDGSLDDVSGGLWPYVMSSTTYNKTI
ncbi:hypothetical protein ACVIW2_003360 [Bradyrhizobium huanghuaihaiense]|uniref:Uncharacterized protein n=1 Tax=Bradyrhizobium huanghuaihaiense TaxID=990078 RepID=A0A562R2P3_9BRAD|nr:hypothetical protein [Bradyrhizobium huanghuaihaiense]TWI63328.1 hypothetical protein IQ16_06387 [Bradyrhizobium huanghuaihaiense]